MSGGAAASVATGASGGSAGGAAGAGEGGASAGSQAGASAQGGSGAAASGASQAQGASAAATGGASAAAAQGGSDWTAGLNDELKGFVQNKSWKGAHEALESYRNLEKLIGAPQDKLIKLPSDDDTAGWDNVYGRLGRPARPEDYGIQPPEKGGDPEFVKWATETFHKNGLSSKQAKSLAEAWNAQMTKTAQDKAEASKAKARQDYESLRREWGAVYEQNLMVADRGALRFGIDPQTAQQLANVMGAGKALKLLHALGAGTGEHAFVGGSNVPGANGPMTPEQARVKIAQLKGDPDFVKKYAAGGAKEREEMTRLHEYAYGNFN
jgi:hypothetical protein